MDVHALLRRGLTALQPTFADLENLKIDADDYAFALLDGRTRAGVILGAMIAAESDATTKEPSTTVEVNASDGSARDDAVVTVVINTPTLALLLGSVFTVEEAITFEQWFAQTRRGFTRIVVIAEGMIRGVLVERRTLRVLDDLATPVSAMRSLTH